jgi:hypothetical protein
VRSAQPASGREGALSWKTLFYLYLNELRDQVNEKISASGRPFKEQAFRARREIQHGPAVIPYLP